MPVVPKSVFTTDQTAPMLVVASRATAACRMFGSTAQTRSPGPTPNSPQLGSQGTHLSGQFVPGQRVPPTLVLMQAHQSLLVAQGAAADGGMAQRVRRVVDLRSDPSDWSDEAIFERIQSVLGGPDAIQLQRGPIIEKTVLPFRSYVCEPLNWGRLVLAGDAGHTVPPTGAKGLNLAFCDVCALIPQITAFFADTNRDSAALDEYSRTALDRVWRAQSFSYWATTLLHRQPEENNFTRRRRRGEFEALTGTEAGRTYFADAYTGWMV